MDILSTQLENERRKVDFDNFDISVKELTGMAFDETIDIAPEYQRHFRWKPSNRSCFIESVFLGIPIPSLFTAQNKDGAWELIDGVQRLSTLINFVGDKDMRSKFGLGSPLKLEGLEILTALNGKTFEDLQRPLALKFLLRPIKITALSDKSDMKVRFDLFERLNTGGVILTTQEIRACIYRGPLQDFIAERAKCKNFLKLVKLPENRLKDGTPEELVLKFFSYLYDRDKFQHSVVGFLNNFMEDNKTIFEFEKNKKLFDDTFSALANELPRGVVRGKGTTTPLTLFEAVAVGAAVAVKDGYSIEGKGVAEWINSEELRKLTTGGGTNTKKKLLSRIEYCAEQFKKLFSTI